MADDPWAAFPAAAPQQISPGASDGAGSPSQVKPTNPWAAFPQAQKGQQPAGEGASTLSDVGHGAGLGLQEGAASVLGFPSDIWKMLDRGYQFALTKGAEKVGMITPEQGASMRQPIPGAEDYHYASQAIEDKFKKGDESLGASTTSPQTVPGQYAETLGQFGVGAAALGAGEAKQIPAAVAKYGLIPGATSETAGQVTKGTSLEPYARVAGAVAGAAPSMAFDAMRSGARGAANAVNSLTPQQDQAAQALLDQSRQAGMPRLSVPEAVQHVTNGTTNLGNIQRVVEQSTKGGETMRQFYADRPTQVEQAARQTLGQIAAPTSAPPAETAANVQNAAKSTVVDVDRARTQAVDPYYKTAARDQVPASDVEGLLNRIETMAADDKTGILSPSLTKLRDSLVQAPGKPAVPPSPTGLLDPSGNPVMSPGTPAVPRTPITDIENLDRVRKFYRDQIKQPQWQQDAIPKEAGAQVGSFLGDLKSMMMANSQPFAEGKQLYKEISNQVVDPLVRSPTGQLAAADTFPKQAAILFNPNPAPGSASAVGNAIRSVAAKDPDAAAQLVRMHIEKTFNEATQQLQSGPNQWGGPKFASVLAGNPQQAANLEAAVRALPNGDLRWNALNNTLQILRAQGMRQPVGSQTEFNRLLVQELRGGTPLGSIMATAASPGRLASFASDVYQNFMYGRNTQQLANLFATGNISDLRRLAMSPARSISGQAAVAGLLGEGSAQQHLSSDGRADGGGVRSQEALGPMVPEPIGDIAAQVQAMIDPKSMKDAVFITPGSPNDVISVPRPEGILLTTNPQKAQAFHQAKVVDEPLMASLLGFPDTKTEAIASGSPRMVQATDVKGNVQAEALTSPKSEAVTHKAIARHAPAAKVRSPPIQQAIKNRVARSRHADGGSVRAPDDLDEMIEAAGARYGIPAPLLRRVMMVESGGKKDAVSNQGALGPMQLMPATAKALGVTDPFDYGQALDAGAKLLRQGLDRNNGRVDQAVAEYHGGPDRANWGPKTAAYVTKVLGGPASGSAPTRTAPDSTPPSVQVASSAPIEPPDLEEEGGSVRATDENDNVLDRRLYAEGMNELSGAAARPG